MCHSCSPIVPRGDVQVNWSPTAGQFGGLAKLGSGDRHAASFVMPVYYTSFGVRPAMVMAVESRTGAVALPRFPSPLIKPDVRISHIRLSDWLHLAAVGSAPMCTRLSRSTPSFS